MFAVLYFSIKKQKLYTVDLYLQNQARNYLEPTELFKGEADEDMSRVVDTEKILRSFKEAYLLAEEMVPTYFPEDKEADLWKFSSDEVFEKLDKFFHRILLLKVIINCFFSIRKYFILDQLYK